MGYSIAKLGENIQGPESLQEEKSIKLYVIKC